MKKDWSRYALALGVLLLVMTVWQGRRIREMETWLESRFSSMEHSLRGDIDRVSGQVRRGLEESTRLAVDDTLRPTGLDAEDRTLLMEVSVTLRQWGADTRAAVLAREGGETAESVLTQTGSGVFTGSVALPVDRRGELALDLAVTTGGETVRESLGSWSDVSMLLPLQRNGWGGPAWTDYRGGVLTLSPDLSMDFCDRNGACVPAVDPVYRVYRNGTLVLERPASTDPNDVKNGWYRYYLVAALGTGLPETEQVTTSCAPGDELLLTLSCADEIGLGYEFTHTRLTITESGPEEVSWEPSDDHPALTWPE